jgi:hypothetical protein
VAPVNSRFANTIHEVFFTTVLPGQVPNFGDGSPANCSSGQTQIQPQLPIDTKRGLLARRQSSQHTEPRK